MIKKEAHTKTNSSAERISIDTTGIFPKTLGGNYNWGKFWNS
jgi:hypothetical protein